MTVTVTVTVTGGVGLQGGRNGGQLAHGDGYSVWGVCGPRYQCLSSWVCGGAGSKGVFEPLEGLLASNSDTSVGPIGDWMEEGWNWLFIFLWDTWLKV